MLTEAHRMLLVPKKPYLLGVSTQTSTGTPMTLTRPRYEAGVVNYALIFRHAGGTAAPGTPTGFTNIATSTTDPDYRQAWEYSNGSVGPTTTSTATSATSMSGIVLAFAQSANKTPTGGGVVTATSTTPDPGSITASPVGMWVLFFAYCAWNGSASVTGWPADTVQGWQVSQGTNGGCAVAMMPHTCLGTRDFGPFTLSASVVNRAGVFGIRQHYAA